MIYVVVGSGPAGVVATEQIRKLDPLANQHSARISTSLSPTQGRADINPTMCSTCVDVDHS